ncbi:MAG TPA: hypothetical protein VEJ84_13815 [Acidimicrobiales bacterium]|nr:hypothetical protein [Acidimicrobiales bacterium]
MKHLEDLLSSGLALSTLDRETLRDATRTGVGAWPARGVRERRLFTDFEKGVMVGLLIGEGHFGGDGRQPQVTLRMHVRHEALFRWIEQTFPGGKLYGPYNHDGRQYLQWMARGSYLRDVLVPVLDDHLTAELDAQTCHRYEEMKARYHRRLGLPAPDEPGEPSSGMLPGQITANQISVGQTPAGPIPAGPMPASQVPASQVPASQVPAVQMPADEPGAEDRSPSPPRSPSGLKAEEIFERLRRERPT